MDLKLGDPTLFGNDAAEEEDPDVLSSYFVNQGDFEEFLDQNARLRFARARKGMGKSALLSKLAHDLRASKPSVLVIHLTGSDLTALGEFSSPDPAVQVNQWQQVICARITQEIGNTINFAMSDRAMLMVESAEVANIRGRNILRALVDRLAGKVASLEVVRPGVTNAHNLLKNFQQTDGDQDVWLLVDDIDSTFVDRPDMRLKVGTFFSACRKLAREVKGLFIRASVRTDVWTILRENEDLDKAEQYMTDIRWTKAEMEIILAKRVLAYIERNYPTSKEARRWTVERNRTEIIEQAFGRRLRWGSHQVPPIQALNILSARRPRWMAQLCRLAGKEATRLGHRRIATQDIHPVLKRFGELRLADLYKEHGHQFSDLRQLIECFAGGPRSYSTDALLEMIQKRYMAHDVEKGIPRLEGKIVRSPMDLAHFLFRTGFLQAQSLLEGEHEEFVDYEERPELLTTDINPDDGLSWAIYPSYRNVLRVR